MNDLKEGLGSVFVSGGASTSGILGVAFVILKLLGIITWKWWLVLLPFYGGLALAIIISIIVLIIVLLFHLY